MPGKSVMGLGVLVLGGLLLAGAIGTGAIGGSGGSDGYYDDYEGYYPDDLISEVTVNALVDPWNPGADSDVSPSEGTRLVAIDFTMTAPADVPDGAYAYGYPGSLNMVDTDGFVYSPLAEGRRPQLTQVYLSAGQKTRGWVTFEIQEDAEIDSLTFYDQEIDLSQD
jgi:hypothetical protein